MESNALPDPYVAVTVQATGMHPASARLVTIDVVTFDEQGNHHKTDFFVINPEVDPGPRHVHGLPFEDIAAAPTFRQVLKPLGALIGKRTLIVHTVPRAWGLISSEARRVMREAAEANSAQRAKIQEKSKNGKNNKKGKRWRPKSVGNVPRPTNIVDIVASCRRQGIYLADTRIAGVAEALGIPTEPPAATLDRAARPAAEIAREATQLLIEEYFTLRGADNDPRVLQVYRPSKLTADRVGLQRSPVRVRAARPVRTLKNPGVYTSEEGLKPGMEVVIAPEIEMEPNELIRACRANKLQYSEKLSRETSVVVCNQRHNLQGKAMHADRKGIPLLTDEEFLAAIDRMGSRG